MKVSIDNTTGLMIEMQGNPREGTLTQNALSAGFTDVSEIEVTEQELAVLIKAKEDARKTPEQIATDLEKAVDRYMDEVANSYRYTNIHTMISYATSSHPVWGAEGVKARDWRDAVYSYCINVQEDVLAGLRAIPTEAELIAELPSFPEQP